jgi:hypothetical protein
MAVGFLFCAFECVDLFWLYWSGADYPFRGHQLYGQAVVDVSLVQEKDFSG